LNEFKNVLKTYDNMYDETVTVCDKRYCT